MAGPATPASPTHASPAHASPTSPAAASPTGAAAASPAATPAPGRPDRPEARTAAGIALALTVLLAGMLALFAWPAARSAPADLPIVLAGPAPLTAQVSAALDQARPGAFSVTTVATRDDAVSAIREQRAYGALVLGPTGAEVLTASARSPVVAQLLGQLGGQLAGGRGLPVTTTDLVPLPTDDPRGAGLVAGLLPIILGGLACAAVSSGALRRRRARITAALGFSVLGGLTLTWLLHSWLGSIGGAYWPAAGVLVLGVAAVALAVLGLTHVLGRAGLALGALLMMLLGNALSGAAGAPELLPAGWGAAGQLLPAGATNSALRSVAFFDGAGATRPLLVLACWAGLGLLLLALPGRATRTAGPA